MVVRVSSVHSIILLGSRSTRYRLIHTFCPLSRQERGLAQDEGRGQGVQSTQPRHQGGRAMATALPGGYAGKILRVDLTNNHIWTQPWTPEMCRTYLGGVGLGAQILWDEVPPE